MDVVVQQARDLLPHSPPQLRLMNQRPNEGQMRDRRQGGLTSATVGAGVGFEAPTADGGIPRPEAAARPLGSMHAGRSAGRRSGGPGGSSWGRATLQPSSAKGPGLSGALELEDTEFDLHGRGMGDAGMVEGFPENTGQGGFQLLQHASDSQAMVKSSTQQSETTRNQGPILPYTVLIDCTS